MIKDSINIKINKDRLFSRLIELGNIGKGISGGVSRIAFSEEDKRGLELIESYMKEAGLCVRYDFAGNLIGRKEGENPSAPVVLTGSHSDTVYEGGKFDGSLGIIGGIEVLQVMKEQGIITEHPIEVIAYRDEEGCRFKAGYSGSRAMTGKWNSETLNYMDSNGMTIRDVLKLNGFDPNKVHEAQRSRKSVKAHVELHIEQGKVLEQKQQSVGIVSGICGSSRGRILLRGEAGHAGTTPMNLRRDPLVAAAKIIQMINEEANKTLTTVGTVGKLEVFPGGANVIPDRVEFSVDIRDLNGNVRDTVEEKVLLRAKEICQESGINMEVLVWRKGESKLCSESIQNIIKDACLKSSVDVFSLPSGAGHDSGNFDGFCPMGMIFVRSKDGVSHHPAEWSSPEDCVIGTNVLYHTLLDLAVLVK
ncbi:Zn-dependent hydrolase [Niallia nealsonii]|uniref:Zn-dependent hydrolase n=1 Tax=Niallia nealsonii TaxID=115979 RepID=A0A2N0Z783_9BACI|nr:Zn-dependent hydrolase [Niallia nealsonii]PKG25344.1 Zn-dependent hydrolase [Niallia nealsonii]